MKNIFFIISFLLIFSCKNPSNFSKSDRPNIILINVDDLGWKDLGFMGSQYYETPFFLPEDSAPRKKDWFFMGTPGFGAPFHLDNVDYPSWQAQVQGLKVNTQTTGFSFLIFGSKMK